MFFLYFNICLFYTFSSYRHVKLFHAKKTTFPKSISLIRQISFIFVIRLLRRGNNFLGHFSPTIFKELFEHASKRQFFTFLSTCCILLHLLFGYFVSTYEGNNLLDNFLVASSSFRAFKELFNHRNNVQIYISFNKYI